MTSEIRANTLKNRVGLGTVSFTNTGPVVSGIVTANGVDINGDIDVDGHTNLDNVSIVGVVTSGNLTISSTFPQILLQDQNHNPDYSIYNANGHFRIWDMTAGAGRLAISPTGVMSINANTNFTLDIDVDGHTNLDNVSIAGVATATTFVGALTGTASGNPTLTGGSNNRVITATGANALTGEANLTFDGTKLQLNTTGSSGEGILLKSTDNTYPAFMGDANRSSTDLFLVALQGYWNGKRVGEVTVESGSDTTNKDEGMVKIRTRNAGDSSPQDRLTVYHTGQTQVHSTTDSSSTTSGALRVDGGIGVAKNIICGGALDMTGGGGIILNADSKLFLEGDSDDDFNALFRKDSENTTILTARYNIANIIDSNNDDTASYWSVRHNGVTLNGSSELMRVQSDGKVGINQQGTPTHQLHVHGTGNTGGARFNIDHTTTTVSGNTASGAFPHNILVSNYNNSQPNNMATIGFDIPATTGSGNHANAVIVGQAEDGNGNCSLQFWTESSNTIGERVRITSNGNSLFTANEVKLYNATDNANTYFYAQNTGAGNAGVRMKNQDGEWTIIANDSLRFRDEEASADKLSIPSTGGIQISAVKNVSATASNTTGSFGSAELILTTPAYAEYQYTWSGQSSYTIDLTCASYFHSEFIYVQHQTNGGTGMQTYIRGKWANNHKTHTCQIHEWYGAVNGLDVTFIASDQSGNGAVNGEHGLTAGGWSNASYRGLYGGGGDKYDGSSSANGRLRISETYNWGSVSTRALIVRVYFGSFAISKS